MARKTKAEADQTRNALLDAAERLFQAQGVSRTSLQDIAQAAGATRGAIYWHFKDKADLFNAMMERVTLPLEQAGQDTAPDEAAAVRLQRMLQMVGKALHDTVHHLQTRRVFDIATHKVELTGELQAVAHRRQECLRDWCVRMSQTLQALAVDQGHALPIPPDAAGVGFFALIDGLIGTWLLTPDGFDLEQVGQLAIDNYLRGLGVAPPPGWAAPMTN
ncbi:MAG: TetR family transcriptional regulator [Burkholderiaceae bacterium]|jgi:TetR/AcrR family acrAB operon transcriptional repressor|nr:TetR family transcriptional regulator [Burkholderiaceae bacterium]